MILLLSILSGLVFWIGGRKWGNKLIRRLGCSAILILTIKILFGLTWHYWWVYLLVFGASYVLVGTYWDFLGKDMGDWQDETVWSWIATGFGYGLVALPLVWTGISLQLIIMRTLALMVLIPFIRKIPSCHLQEAFSGFVYILTLVILR